MTVTTAALPTGTWQLDTAATSVTVAVRKLGLFTIPADLAVTSGTIEIDGNHELVNVEIVADAASYTSKNAKRNEHVFSEDFLDASNHPTISFRTGAVAQSGSDYQASGTVTLKGQTSPIDVTIADVQLADDSGSFTASATIDRRAIGVDKFPTFFVGRDLELTVSAKASKTA